MNTDDLLRQKFNEVQKKINKIEGKSIPLRKERDDILNTAKAHAQEIEAEYKKIEEPLFELKQELSRLSKVFGRSLDE